MIRDRKMIYMCKYKHYLIGDIPVRNIQKTLQTDCGNMCNDIQ